MTTPPVQRMTPPQAEELNPHQFEGMTPQQAVELIRQLERELNPLQLEGMTPQQVVEGIRQKREANRQLREENRQLREVIRQRREAIMRETRPQTRETTPQRNVVRVLFYSLMAWQFAILFLCILIVVFSDSFGNREINISIYLWICYALVYLWLLKNRILSVYASYQHKAPFYLSLLSAYVCIVTCIAAFHSFCQSQTLTIFQILLLCLFAVIGSMVESFLRYNYVRMEREIA